jgi:hypothetical protein
MCTPLLFSTCFSHATIPLLSPTFSACEEVPFERAAAPAVPLLSHLPSQICLEEAKNCCKEIVGLAAVIVAIQKVDGVNTGQQFALGL